MKFMKALILKLIYIFIYNWTKITKLIDIRYYPYIQSEYIYEWNLNNWKNVFKITKLKAIYSFCKDYGYISDNNIKQIGYIRQLSEEPFCQDKNFLEEVIKESKNQLKKLNL